MKLNLGACMYIAWLQGGSSDGVCSSELIQAGASPSESWVVTYSEMSWIGLSDAQATSYVGFGRTAREEWGRR